MGWTHSRAVWMMVVATAMWSIAGVVTRQLDSAQSFELTFWRSLFTALCLLLFLRVLQGPGVLSRLINAPKRLWLSGLCWSVMFTAFMVALTLASVAEVLVTMSVGPLLTALVARIFYKQTIQLPTWIAIVIAGAGMFWMYAQPQVSGLAWGTLIGFLVPTAAAVNWCVVQDAQKTGDSLDLLPAVLVGAVISALATLAFAWPLQSSAHDIAWLALLGLVQLAMPCTLLVFCARILSAPEISLLSLLEVLFGIFLAWVGAGEEPNARVISGGILVIVALVVNAYGMKSKAMEESKS
ncbi:MAG: DMT family transporter [Burkholderiales bacterium]|nr:DMT family transporter [Burkholderiales bacterium]